MSSRSEVPNDGRRSWCGVIAVVFAVTVIAGAFWYHKWREPSREARKLNAVIRSLANHRPPEMTPRQWESAVAWTINLDANSLTFLADASSIRSLRVELEGKLEGDVDMETIGWIWDSYAQLCSAGKRYQRFRPRMLDEIANGGGNWGIDIP